MTPPPSYREQDACANCNYVFERHNYDQGEEYFCAWNTSPRPKCMSQMMEGESVDDIGSPEYHAGWDAWDDWANEHRVKPYAICHAHARREREA